MLEGFGGGVNHLRRMSAEDAVRDGQCTVLASDYSCPSLLHAMARLVHTITNFGRR